MKATLDPRKLQLAPAAEKAWRGIVDAIETKMADGGEYEQIRGFAGKLPTRRSLRWWQPG